VTRSQIFIGTSILLAFFGFALWSTHEHFFGRWDTQQQFEWVGKEFGARLLLDEDGKGGMLTAQRKGQPGKVETERVVIRQTGIGTAGYIIALQGELPLDFVANQQGPHLLYCLNCMKAKGWQLPLEWTLRSR
jgi:hypothetical protein